MLAKPQGFPRKLGGCAGLDPRLRSAVSAGVGDGERGLRRGLRAPGVGVRPKRVLEYSPSNKRIRYFVSITYVRTGLWTAHKFCGGGELFSGRDLRKTFSAPLRLCVKTTFRNEGSLGSAPNVRFGFRYLGSMTNSGSEMITLVRGGTERVSQTLPPMTEPSPIVVSPPRIVAPE